MFSKSEYICLTTLIINGKMYYPYLSQIRDEPRYLCYNDLRVEFLKYLWNLLLKERPQSFCRSGSCVG